VSAAFSDHEQLIAQQDVDVVAVTVKVPHHRELVSAALAAGKTVYCEWPLGRDLDDAKAMAVLAAEQRVHTVVGLQGRQAPAIEFLGDLLRDSVAPSGEMQTLDAQIAWLRRYAQILETRHAGHLAFRWDIGNGTPQALLPTLLLQPLVENAVKHGALMRRGGGEIVVRTELSGPRLVCTVEDNGPGIADKPTRDGAFGLVSVRRRLELRYAKAATLRLESSAGRTRSVIELPLEQGGSS